MQKKKIVESNTRSKIFHESLKTEYCYTAKKTRSKTRRKRLLWGIMPRIFENQRNHERNNGI